LWYGPTVSDYLSEKFGLRIGLNGPFGVVNDQEVHMAGEFGDILRWTTSGRMLGVAVQGLSGDFASGRDRIVEVSADGETVFLGKAGGKNLARFGKSR
jgi:hypothetical protein